MNSKQCETWLASGVVIPAPESVEIGPEVPLSAVAPGAVLHAGTKLFGEKTSIGPGCELGREAPVTIEDCQLGAKVKLKGGYFAKSVFLDGAAMGSGAQVREGCLLEEGAEMAHTAGLKQTILFPYAVGGSLINFCDALLSGGTSRKRHSEIGSSFIHFNYTPRGDKATASLFGDVPRGVMLRSDPIFLGGQGGVVGPVRVEYGTVLAAGNVLRSDVEIPGQLVVPPPAKPVSVAFPKEYLSVRRKLRNCAVYIGNLAALEAWYRAVRAPVLGGTAWGRACYDGALRVLAIVRKERLKRLDAVFEAVSAQSDRGGALEESLAKWQAIRPGLEGDGGDAGAADRDAFLAAWAKTEGAYLERIAALDAAAVAAGTAWLQAVVDRVSGF
ncbi:MAG: UDP-N-acetylglucosamine pyrophosphorylase [Kiritimatiellae bacterium]|nr:UDP-N-acetylglucosamine pyrophosphorylase [Kiritimatiellia bacterium]